MLGPSVSPDVVAGLLGVPPHEAARRCERAAATRLLVPAGRTYEFANDLVQEVLYATTPAPTRAVHHRRAADLLVAPPEAVGRHAAAVEDWPRAARAWLLAGERTRRRSAADAVALLDRALDAARRGDEPELVGRVLIARGRAREALERYADALDDHRAALAAAREAGDRRLEMVALRELGGDAVVGAGSPVAECVPPLRSCLRIAAALGDRAAEADALARLAVLATHRLSFAEACDHGRRAAAAGRAAGDDAALVVGLDGLKTAYAYLGEVAALRDVVEELEPLARRTGDLFRLHWVLFEGALAAVAAADWADGAGRHRGGPRREPAQRLRRPRGVDARAPGLGRAPAGAARGGGRSTDVARWRSATGPGTAGGARPRGRSSRGRWWSAAPRQRPSTCSPRSWPRSGTRAPRRTCCAASRRSPRRPGTATSSPRPTRCCVGSTRRRAGHG